ncbi:MAG: hypothetical protein AMJ90_07195 [candidate division Zixibacteria bacterium SM23_73_2]|nr:MAG: hypothetical protein AMJ90_07195 [candidate division Zixibacteria bacterium SM23_73_2]
MDILKEISENLELGDFEKVSLLTKKAIEEKIPVEKILKFGLIGGMDIVGEKYKTHQIFLPDVLMSARAMHAGMDVLKPFFIREGMPNSGKVILGTIQGDLHDIGKNLVGIMLKGAGFEVIDLGTDVSPEKFIETAKKEAAYIIGMSALLTTTMPMMRKVVELLKKEGLEDKVKTIIGGAPVSKDFAQSIGADAYGYDSTDAVESVRKLFNQA